MAGVGIGIGMGLIGRRARVTPKSFPGAVFWIEPDGNNTAKSTLNGSNFSTIFDQTSPQYNLTQSDVAKQPPYLVDAFGTGLPAIDTRASTNHYLTGTGQLVAAGSPFIITIVYSPLSVIAQTTEYLLGFGTNTGIMGCGSFNGNGRPLLVINAGTVLQVPDVVRNNGIYIIDVISDGAATNSNYTITVSGGNNTLSGARAQTSISSLFVSKLAAAASQFKGLIGPIYIGTNTSVQSNLRAYLARIYRQKNVLCMGDSLTLGQGATVPWPTKLQTLWGGYHTQNAGIGGNTLVQMNTRYNTDLGTKVGPSVYENVAVNWGGINDLFGGASATDCLTRLQTLNATARAAGARRVINMTVIKAATVTGSADTHRQTFNTSILAGSSGADIVIDLASRPEFSNTGNTTYYQGDGVHLTNAALSVIADQIYAVL